MRHLSRNMKRLYKYKCVEYSTPIENRYYCPIPDCGLFVRTNTADLAFRRATCPRNHLTCVDCRQKAHDDAIQCVKNKDMELVQKLAQEEGWRRCYRCHTMVEHENACRHMTCRCGAEFCYVCGSVWFTCSCTERQLTHIKKRAKEVTIRRKAQEERERREVEELKKALEAIAKMEAKETEKREKIRAAKETQRKKQVHRKYADFRARLNEIYLVQASGVDGEHRDNRMHLEEKRQTTMEALGLKHVVKMRELRASLTAKIEECEKRCEHDWQERIADAKKPEADDAAQLDEPAKSVKSGECREEELLKAQQCKHEHECDRYAKTRDDELERLRWALDEELAIERELMDAKKARIEESFKVQQRELWLKVRSEARWLELVKSERSKLLDKFMEAELADEIIDVDDDRWNHIIVKEEISDAGPSRFRSAVHHAKGSGIAADAMDAAEGEPGPSSERQALESKEPTPPSWNPLSLSMALNAAWDGTRDTIVKRPHTPNHEQAWEKRRLKSSSNSCAIPPRQSLPVVRLFGPQVSEAKEQGMASDDDVWAKLPEEVVGDAAGLLSPVAKLPALKDVQRQLEYAVPAWVGGANAFSRCPFCLRQTSWVVRAGGRGHCRTCNLDVFVGDDGDQSSRV